MDPISIASTILVIAGKCITVTKSLSDLRGRFAHANLTISAICSESAVVNAALYRLQHLFNDESTQAFSRFRGRPDLSANIDLALTGCTLLYSCLDDEVRKLRFALDNAGRRLTTTQKAKAVWKDGTMKGMLQQIRGQATALNLLLQCFQLEHAAETRQLLRDQSDTIRQIRNDISALRSLYPAKHSIPDSVLGDRPLTQDIFADAKSIIDEREFEFDDIVVNSRVYRRVLAAAMSCGRGRNTFPESVKSYTGNEYHVRDAARGSEQKLMSPGVVSFYYNLALNRARMATSG
ncbi:hypothetical protein QBC46DRAFT_340532 [Diplogelasinospora grovesii]|uniref:Fungal N-terminal domain-containing protein n=1 Tax=Diplogelasinospora grovesii TaxID=303347 RepID=A0AAN6NAE0_9PEZI|nr:hypothetical protein QBC46DRAFT_340532 [Diplogelasinospora grovesii]